MIAPRIPKNEEDRIADLYALNLGTSDKREQFKAVILILSRCINVPIAYISSIDSEKQNIHASCGLSFDASDRKSSFCGHTILQNEILIVEDTHKDKRFFDNPMVINDPKIRFYAGYPLPSFMGNNIGALCIADTVPRKLDDVELRLFKVIGKLLTERMRLYKLNTIQKQIEESKNQLERLNKELYKSNEFYQQLFGQYMSETLMEQVMNDKKETKLGGEERYVTVLISDLRGFSPLSEKYSPQTIVKVLNIYFEEMIKIIHEHEGYINEILGDGILVIFGAPKHVERGALKSVKCARAMQRGMIKVNKKLENKNLPRLEMGIGINSGKLIVGNIGSKERMKYGVVGENINIAARIEAFTIPGQVLISEATYKNISEDIQPVGSIRTKIKGFNKPIRIFDVSEFSEIDDHE